MRHRIRAAALIGTALLTVVCATACAKSVTTAAIEEDPASYYGDVVVVTGEVSGGYEVSGYGLYELRDATGKIWVVTLHGLPADGLHVSVRGRVNEPVSLGVIEIGTHVVEDERESE